MDDQLYELTEHAKQRILERGIQLSWLDRAIRHPDRIDSHPDDPTCSYALVVIPEYGDRVLKVVYNHTESPVRIVTAFFDRKLKGKL